MPSFVYCVIWIRVHCFSLRTFVIMVFFKGTIRCLSLFCVLWSMCPVSGLSIIDYPFGCPFPLFSIYFSITENTFLAGIVKFQDSQAMNLNEYVTGALQDYIWVVSALFTFIYIYCLFCLLFDIPTLFFSSLPYILAF